MTADALTIGRRRESSSVETLSRAVRRPVPAQFFPIGRADSRSILGGARGGRARTFPPNKLPGGVALKTALPGLFNGLVTASRAHSRQSG